MLELTRPAEPDGPLCAQLRGVVDAEILRRTLSNVATACARTGEETIVLDLREMESRCSLLDIQNIGIDLDRAGFQPSWRMAVVGTQITANFAVFERLCEGRGAQVRFFKTTDEASIWLATGP